MDMKYADEEIIASQCVEHAEYMIEKQAETLRIANEALRKLGMHTLDISQNSNAGAFHYDECPIYKSAQAFDLEYEQALNPKAKKSPRIREFHSKKIMKMLENRITCPVCLSIREKKKEKK